MTQMSLKAARKMRRKDRGYREIAVEMGMTAPKTVKRIFDR
jgi:hypothetical protein